MIMLNCSFYSIQVDKHIRKLDSDLARFEAELKEKNRGSPKQGIDT
jgi:hypothetical protein